MADVLKYFLIAIAPEAALGAIGALVIALNLNLRFAVMDTVHLERFVVRIVLCVVTEDVKAERLVLLVLLIVDVLRDLFAGLRKGLLLFML